MTEYNLLGIKLTATDEEVKQAFRKKAFELHPDRNKSPDATKQFIELKNAYERIMQSRNIPQNQWNVTFSSGSDNVSYSQSYTVIIKYG